MKAGGVKMRKADVNCPKCGHRFTVRDNGGLSRAEADRAWSAFDKAFAAMARAFAKWHNPKT